MLHSWQICAYAHLVMFLKRLLLYQLRIDAALVKQLIMSSALRDFAILKNEDVIRILDRGKAVRYRYGCSILCGGV